MMSVPAASSACKIENTTHKYCLRPDGAHVVLMSDTYIDACGKTYRGVWVVPFMHSEDNMGTLLGKGRIIINRPGTSSYDKDYISGDTYAVKASDFLFLTETFPGDDASIAKYRQQALTKEYYLMSDYTFKRK